MTKYRREWFAYDLERLTAPEESAAVDDVKYFLNGLDSTQIISITELPVQIDTSGRVTKFKIVIWYRVEE